MPPIRVSAPAKINFHLHITGKRVDGYHLLESLVGFAEFGDMVECVPADELTLTVNGPFAATLGDNSGNLVICAAEALRAYTGCTKGAAIVLHKYIPIGAGLGGGSSDAAAALKGLVQLWQLQLADETLYTIAATLGSDVPACLKHRPAWLNGVGDQLSFVSLPEPGWCVLVNPNQSLLTADVYKAFNSRFSAAEPAVTHIPDFPALVDFMRTRHNALEASAITKIPIISGMLRQLRATAGCAIARMSGSGATCFALYANEKSAQTAAAQLRTQGCWVQATKLLGSNDGKTQ